MRVILLELQKYLWSLHSDPNKRVEEYSRVVPACGVIKIREWRVLKMVPMRGTEINRVTYENGPAHAG